MSCFIYEVSADPPHLYIGCILPLSGGYWNELGHESLRSAQQAVRDINNNTDILSAYELHLVCNDSRGDINVALEAVVSQVFDPPHPKLMLFGGVMSTVTITMARVLALWHVIVVSPLATAPTLSNRDEFPGFFRTHPSQYIYNDARLEMCKAFGWTTVATLYQTHEKFIVAMDAFHKQLTERNMSLLVTASFDIDPKEQLARLKGADARIIAAAFYQDRALEVFCEAYKIGLFGPKYVWLVPSRWLKQGWWLGTDEDSVDCTVNELLAANNGMFGLDVNAWDISNEPTVSGMTSQQIKSVYEAEQQEVNLYGSLSYDAIWSMALALDKSEERFQNGEAGYHDNGIPKQLLDYDFSDNNMLRIMEEEMQNTFFRGVSGIVHFDENGERETLVHIEQNLDGVYRTIGYYDSSTENINWTLEIKDIFTTTGGSVPVDAVSIIYITNVITTMNVFVVMATCSAIGLLWCLGLLTFNLYHREKRVIKMSSPNLNNFIILGCLLLYTLVIVHGLDTSQMQGPLCQIEMWLISTGFTLSFGAMFLKTWRIFKIFTNKTAQKVVIKDNRLLCMLGALVFVDIIVLLLWLFLDPPRPTVYKLETKRDVSPENDDVIFQTENCVYICSSKNATFWMTALAVYKGILLVFGVFLTFQTRKVYIRALNDSKHVAIAIYNVVVLCFIGVPTFVILQDKPKESYVISG
ncbi:gamma-aminobutyric acid type B receptor subunit 1-like, partial [Saccoglossus kowalevskii]